MRWGEQLQAASQVAWERAFLSAMQARGVPWVPLYRIVEAVPCAELHTATGAVRRASA